MVYEMRFVSTYRFFSLLMLGQLCFSTIIPAIYRDQSSYDECNCSAPFGCQCVHPIQCHTGIIGEGNVDGSAFRMAFTTEGICANTEEECCAVPESSDPTNVVLNVNEYGNLRCRASLINKRVALTSAQCGRNKNKLIVTEEQSIEVPVELGVKYIIQEEEHVAWLYFENPFNNTKVLPQSKEAFDWNYCCIPGVTDSENICEETYKKQDWKKHVENGIYIFQKQSLYNPLIGSPVMCGSSNTNQYNYVQAGIIIQTDESSPFKVLDVASLRDWNAKHLSGDGLVIAPQEEFREPKFQEPNKACQRKSVGKYPPWELDVLSEQYSKQEFFCSATLIHRRAALTSKDCILSNMISIYVTPRDNRDRFNEVISYITDIGDLALLFLNQPFDCIPQVCWPPPKDQVWKKCFVTGYQQVGNNNGSDIENKKTHIYGDWDEKKLHCELQFNHVNLSTAHKLFSMREARDTCKASMGSPLMCTTEENPTHYVQVAVVQQTQLDILQWTNNFNISEVRPHINEINMNLDNDTNWSKSTIDDGYWTTTCEETVSPAQSDEFPWLLAVYSTGGNKYNCEGSSPENPPSPRRTFLCAATLIHKRIALTAAHCVYCFDNSDYLRVRSGVWKLSHETYKGHVDKKVTSIKIHEDFGFDYGIYYNNIALLILEDDFDMKESVLPKLNNLPAIGDLKDCFSIGWGHYSDGANMTHQYSLQKVKSPIIDNYNCTTIINAKEYIQDFLEIDLDGIICAGGVKKRDTCQIGGGSPLLCRILNNQNYVQVGVASTGGPCGREVPAFYAHVQLYAEWINTTMSSSVIG